MPDAPSFMQGLGLDGDADERAIRRAYAQRLKLVDPEADPHGFQELRETYELAMRWVREGKPEAQASDAFDEPEESGATPPQELPSDAEPVATLTQSLGAQAFAAFTAHLQSRGLSDLIEAEKLIDATLADESMLNLEAGTAFEARVAALLMNGWHPGHEFLFEAACDRFAWESNPQRLTIFGGLGAAVDAAINERSLFQRQDRSHYVEQRDLIRMVRTTATPDSPSYLSREVPLLLTLLQRYPNWLPAIVSREQINAWVDRYEALPQDLRDNAPKRDLHYSATQQQAPTGRSSRESGWSFAWRFAFGAIFILFRLASCASQYSGHHN